MGGSGDAPAATVRTLVAGVHVAGPNTSPASIFRNIDLALANLDTHSVCERGLHIHYDDATQAWWVVDDEDLAALGRMLDAGQADAYSHWCSETASTAVDPARIVRDYDADETTDLDALMAEAGASDDMVSYFGLSFLRDDVEAVIEAFTEDNAA